MLNPMIKENWDVFLFDHGGRKGHDCEKYFSAADRRTFVLLLLQDRPRAFFEEKSRVCIFVMSNSGSGKFVVVIIGLVLSFLSLCLSRAAR